MFLVPPQVPFLPAAHAREELLQFGDPTNLKQGVLLKKKGENSEPVKDVIIHSLYDMELNVKYVTEQGNVIKRISDKQIVVKKKTPKTVKTIQGSNIQVAQSSPIKIPETTTASIRIPSRKNSMQTSVPSIPPLNNVMSSAIELLTGGTGSSRSMSGGSSEEHTETDYSRGDDSFDSRSGSSFDDIEFISKSPTFVSITPSSFDDSDLNSSVGTPKQSFSIVVDIQTTSAPGERLEKIIDDVVYVKSPNKHINGVLYLTNYQFIFMSYERKPANAFFSTPDGAWADSSLSFDSGGSGAVVEIMIPLTTISRFEKVENSHFMFGSGEGCNFLDIYTKDFRRPLRLSLDPLKHSKNRKDILDYLSQCVFPSQPEHVFAFNSKQNILPPNVRNGWKVYDPVREYKRLGVGESKNSWKWVDINSDYSFCKSYPKSFVVPDGILDSELKEVAAFRSKSRIPILGWRNKATGVSLTRCSQPKTGMRNTRCKEDEKLISLIQRSNPCSRKLHIMDARPMTNAFANMALGGGYENLNFYPDCELEFMGIGNIHVVRDSWNKLRDLCEVHCTSTDNTEKDKNVSNGSFWLSQLETTRWLDYIGSIINGALTVVNYIEVKKEDVLIHCSDGWDRTPQVSALAQLLLDEYYRTIEGFIVLIEKEWLHFGHKFGDRLGLNFNDSTYKDVERSPIFLQFIDCTWQVMQQFPYSFEFSDELLITIMDFLYSSRFGTFLYNSEKEREDHRVSELTPSLWTYILENSNSYRNPFYQPSKQPSVLFPNPSVHHLQLWRSYYFKYLSPSLKYKNKYVELGREMKNTIENLQADYQNLLKENELLQRQLAELTAQKNGASSGTQHMMQSTTEVNCNGSLKNTKKNDPTLDDWVDISRSNAAISPIIRSGTGLHTYLSPPISLNSDSEEEQRHRSFTGLWLVVFISKPANKMKVRNYSLATPNRFHAPRSSYASTKTSMVATTKATKMSQRSMAPHQNTIKSTPRNFTSNVQSTFFKSAKTEINSRSGSLKVNSKTRISQPHAFSSAVGLRSFITERDQVLRSETPVGEDEPEKFVPPPGMKVKESTYMKTVEPNWNAKLQELYNKVLEAITQLPENTPIRDWLEATCQFRLAVLKTEDDYEVVERVIGEGQVELMIAQAQGWLKSIPDFIEFEKLRASQDPEATDTVVMKRYFSDAYRKNKAFPPPK